MIGGPFTYRTPAGARVSAIGKPDGTAHALAHAPGAKIRLIDARTFASWRRVEPVWAPREDRPCAR